MKILAEAGFREFEATRLDTVMVMGQTPEEAANEALALGPLARAAATLDEDTRAKIRDAVAAKMPPFETDLGITPPAACWLVSAR
jgi:hypothetical protein